MNGARISASAEGETGAATRPTPNGAAAAGEMGSAGAAAAPPSYASLDLFDLGRRAAEARNGRLGGSWASFVRSRQLLATGAWRGPRDATESYVEAADLAALGGWSAAQAAGVTLLVGGEPSMAGGATEVLAPHLAARVAGGRSLWRFFYRAGEGAAERRSRVEALRALARRPDLALWGVLPAPIGEPQGLDTLHLIATLRLELPELAHVALDVGALGPRLAQMALGFGADELWAPIVSERALRLGANAKNPAMTRKEAIVLIRGAGLTARERTGPDAYSEESP